MRLTTAESCPNNRVHFKKIGNRVGEPFDSRAPQLVHALGAGGELLYRGDDDNDRQAP